jgi:hypothetical protein
MRGDWAAALNPIWSPMYSWILGPVMHVVNPTMEWEFPLVQMVNFCIYMFALVCFEFFWRRVVVYQKSLLNEKSSKKFITLPDWAWQSIGYTVFIFCSLNLIEIWAVTPDMLMSSFVYLVSGILITIRIKGASYGRYILFGGLLGISYLVKAVMFPIAILFLGISLFMGTSVRRAIPFVLTASIVFFLFSASFIALVSFSRGELKFGDAGKLTYLRYINDLHYPHWQGEPAGSGTPEHPSRIIFNEPPIYEFGTPIAGTYPISYDPSYWYEGAEYRFNLAKQISYLIYSIHYYLDLFFRQQAGLTIGLIWLCSLSQNNPFNLTGMISRWGLLIPALGAFSFYGIFNVIGRYIGMFVVLFWGELLANIHLPDTAQIRKTATGLILVMILLMVISIGIFNFEGLLDLIGGRNPHQQIINKEPDPAPPLLVAKELHRLGVMKGDRVAVIGYAFSAFWARLARVRIVSEMLGSDARAFWLGDSLLQTNVLKAFARSGAVAVVAEHAPSYATLPGWHRVTNSNSFIYIY